MLPIGRRNLLFSVPRVVHYLIALNVTIFLAALIAGKMAVVQRFGLVPASIHTSTLFSHMFVHAGVLHVLGNMFFLWMFGDNVEDVLGHVTFAISYLVCGLGAAFSQYLSNPHSVVPMVGASGAISGVMALYAVFLPTAEFDLDFYVGWWRVASKPAKSKTAVAVWFIEQLLLATIMSTTHSSAVGIAFWAHVGGFITGLLIGAALFILGWADKYQARVAAHSGKSQKAPGIAAS